MKKGGVRKTMVSGCQASKYSNSKSERRENMRKSLLIASIAVVSLFAASTAMGTWTPPDNVRVVQQSRSSLPNVYPNIQAAFASIPTSGSGAPSVSNPYLVKIMPGVYDLGTTSLQMRAYVDVEGSG